MQSTRRKKLLEKEEEKFIKVTVEWRQLFLVPFAGRRVFASEKYSAIVAISICAFDGSKWFLNRVILKWTSSALFLVDGNLLFGVEFLPKELSQSRADFLLLHRPSCDFNTRNFLSNFKEKFFSTLPPKSTARHPHIVRHQRSKTHHTLEPWSVLCKPISGFYWFSAGSRCKLGNVMSGVENVIRFPAARENPP